MRLLLLLVACTAFQRTRATLQQGGFDSEPGSDGAFFEQMWTSFDINGDNKIDLDEVEAMLPSMTTSEDKDKSTPEQRARGFMEMLDEDGNGFGSRVEMQRFLKKMQDMDGRLDRLPQPAQSGKKRRRKRAPREEL